MIERKNRRELLFTAAAVSMFVTSSGLIKAPFSGRNAGNPISILIAGTLFLITAAAAPKILHRLLKKEKINVGIKILYIILSVILLAAAFTAFKEYVIFVYDIILPKTPKFFIATVFAICALFLSFSKYNAIYKFSLISATAVSLIFFALFMLSVKNFTERNIFSGVNRNTVNIIKEVGKYYLCMFLPALIPFGFLSVEYKPVTANSLAGAGWGLLLSLVCIADSVLSFGYTLASRLNYPYIEDISTVTVGSLFTRMDAFAYFAFFPAYLIKCAISLKLAIILCKKVALTKNN